MISHWRCICCVLISVSYTIRWVTAAQARNTPIISCHTKTWRKLGKISLFYSSWIISSTCAYSTRVLTVAQRCYWTHSHILQFYYIFGWWTAAIIFSCSDFACKKSMFQNYTYTFQFCSTDSKVLSSTCLLFYTPIWSFLASFSLERPNKYNLRQRIRAAPQKRIQNSSPEKFRRIIEIKTIVFMLN